MIKPEHIPDEVIHAACEEYGGGHFVDMKHALAVAISAWPEAKAAWFLPQGKVYMLPAPWENPKREKNDE